MVALRSPAITTPPSNVSATIVVPCGAIDASVGGTGRLPGRSDGAWPERKSTKDGDPGVRNALGSRPGEGAWSGPIEAH
jgi:hypothetical protein